VGTIAFFDFDGTLIRHDSGVVCALPSARRGLLGPRIFAELVSTWVLSKVGLRARTDAMRVGFRCYAGLSLDELRALMAELYEVYLKADLSPAAGEQVRAHREAGDRLVILTASAFFFAEPIARDLGFDEVVGTQVAFSEGRCTGVVEGDIVDGAVKLAAARAIAERDGTDLSRCVFYSDHVADLPLLEAVGTPVAVGPNRALERVARARGYRILAH
jgi:putative phosphoserine phosphatase/1-acylglycerol-3-phosphate O-acyltransferase